MIDKLREILSAHPLFDGVVLEQEGNYVHVRLDDKSITFYQLDGFVQTIPHGKIYPLEHMCIAHHIAYKVNKRLNPKMTEDVFRKIIKKIAEAAYSDWFIEEDKYKGVLVLDQYKICKIYYRGGYLLYDDKYFTLIGAIDTIPSTIRREKASAEDLTIDEQIRKWNDIAETYKKVYPALSRRVPIYKTRSGVDISGERLYEINFEHRLRKNKNLNRQNAIWTKLDMITNILPQPIAEEIAPHLI